MVRRFFFAMIGIVLASQAARADTRDEVWAAMQRCQAIADDRTWLDCTYGAKQPMRAKLGLQPAPEYQQRLVPPATVATASLPKTPQAAPPHHKGGFLEILGGSTPPLTVSTLAAVRYDSQGAFVLTLQNGQVWRQTDAESGMKVRLKIGSRVTVRSGALWSYNLKTDDSPHEYKVEPKT